MITEIKSYQIIIALLKARGIRHCVLSAGSRNVPFVHSIEEDPFFKCYSVVDERSAGYFALGCLSNFMSLLLFLVHPLRRLAIIGRLLLKRIIRVFH